MSLDLKFVSKVRAYPCWEPQSALPLALVGYAWLGQSSLFVVTLSGKKFNNVDTWGQCYKTLLSVIDVFFVLS
jgi:hypothetical protein